jgi:hypothetical protein
MTNAEIRAHLVLHVLGLVLPASQIARALRAQNLKPARTQPAGVDYLVPPRPAQLAGP